MATMMILVTTLFLLPPMLVTRYLYMSGEFINRKAFQLSLFSAGLLRADHRDQRSIFLPRLRHLGNNPGFAN
ncbi:MAG: hypothetical protein ABI604_10880 [Nitrospirota bacterium]